MNLWAKAIGFEAGEDDQPNDATLIEHIRNAVIEAGLVARGRITSGLREAYRPLQIDENILALKMDRALDTLTKSGDLLELTTATGRAYMASQARLVQIDEHRNVLLGSAQSEAFSGVVRAGSRSALSPEPMPITTLEAEIGVPDWRLALVELGGFDDRHGDAGSLYKFAKALASSGQHFRLDDADIAILSGQGDFFGSFNKPVTGRWQNVGAVGCFPAVLRKQYTAEFIIVNSDEADASFWKPETIDLWRWVTIGFTLSLGQPIFRFDKDTGLVGFLVPLPRQLQRLMLLAAEPKGAWNWIASETAMWVLERLVGMPR